MAKESKEKETFIIQNVTPGYHCIADMKLTIGPLEVVDLTNKDETLVKGSQNLRDSLRAGFVRKISETDAERIATTKIAKQRKGVADLQKRSKDLQTLDIDGKTIDVEPINIDRTNSSKMSEQVSTAGFANDPMSYTVAFDIAQQLAEARGEELTVEDFAAKVERDNDLVRRLITSNSDQISPTAKTADSSATYAAVDSDGEVVVRKQRMSKVELAPAVPEYNGSGGEAIDLTEEA